ncbi:MAG: hypothetical protein ABWW69_06645 [Pyrodictiaceae archaeon]
MSDKYSSERLELNLFNLIISHLPGRYEFNEAMRILRSLLPGLRVFDTPPPLILARVEDPYLAVKFLMENIPRGSPIIRAIPLDAVTLPYLSHVKLVVEKLAKRKLEPSDTFAIRLEGHLYASNDKGVRRLHKDEAIRAIAEKINNKVKLYAPDKLILIKVVRVSRALRYAGIMVAPPSSIYAPLKSSRNKY